MIPTLIVHSSGPRRGSIMGVSLEGRTFMRAAKGLLRRGKDCTFGMASLDGQPEFQLRVKALRRVGPDVIRPLLEAAGKKMQYGHWYEVAID